MKSQAKRKKVFVGMSGGVDSSVTAALLKYGGFSAQGGPASGWDVYGVHIKMWSPMESLRDSTRQADPFFPVCQQQHQDQMDAMRVAAHLNIPFATWDFTAEYREAVVAYMIREYAAGRTPNPDVMCNREIKFGIFLRRALAEGADCVATGHYVRVANVADSRGLNADLRRHYTLMKAEDDAKDQSYFLWTLTQEQLRHCLFPIGEYTKPEVREMARKFGLPTAEKKDSQGICFIGEIDLREFLKRHIPVSPGPIVTTAGKTIGTHEGLSFYTLGQRQGMGIGGGIPYYVAEKDVKTNTLVVSEGPFDEALFVSEVRMSEVNWISGIVPEVPFECEARIRYRQPLQSCRIVQTDADFTRTDAEKMSALVRVQSALVSVIFDESQRAATPGQSVVFYQGEEMLGGGIII